MPISTSVLAALSKLLARQAPTAAEAAALAAAREAAPPQKMLQGMYRGYAGDYDAAKAAQDAGLVYVTPQRAVAESYANNRVKQAARRGEKVDPHVEMVLVDPASGRRYGHSTLGTGEQGPLRTLAAELQPEDVVSTTNLYAEGGEVSADELNRPFIGYRSAGRRPESQQDRRAAADAPLSALRGMVSGVLGAPGDIESLIRMLPGLSEQTVLPTSEDVRGRLPGRSLESTPVGRAATELGTLGGGFYTGPGSPLRAMAALPSAVSRAGRDFAMAAGQPAVNVVKPKGGNWLAGSVERVIEPMRTRVVGSDPAARLRDLDAAYAQNVEAGVAMDPAVFARERARLEPEAAMNRWLETKLGKYMRNEMATPEDPLRALAERGVLHYDPTPTGYSVSKQRIAAGFPEEGMAQSDLAKRWEKRADTFFNELQASDLTRGYPELVEKDPWLAKVPPETRVYELLGGANEELGMQHLVDELKNAINPTSGLPENLRLKYSDLEKVTVPQAVERVAKINDWRAAQKAEADMARAMNPATQVVKEYPEQGFKWVELNVPKETGKNVSRTKSAEEIEMLGEGVETMPYDDIVEMTRNMAKDEGIRPGTQQFNEMLQENVQMFGEKPSTVDESIKAFQDAVRYEGEQMGHSVAGYADEGSYGLGGLGAIKEGRAKIYSLRDKKGQPHVTIEVKPGVENPSITEGEFKGQRRFIVNNKGTGFPTIEEAQKYAQEISTPEIVQIKGKGNKAPKEDYLPAVQDFIRSGSFGKVGDLQNAGLIDARAAGKPLPGRPAFMTEDEFKAYEAEIKGEGFATGGLVQKYADGGVVNNGLVGSNIYNSDAMQNPASAYRFADGGQAGDVRAYADGGLVANSHTADFDPARIDAIVGDLNALNAG